MRKVYIVILVCVLIMVNYLSVFAFNNPKKQADPVETNKINEMERQLRQDIGQQKSKKETFSMTPQTQQKSATNQQAENIYEKEIEQETAKGKDKKDILRDALDIPLKDLQKAKRKVEQYREVLEGNTEDEMPNAVSRIIYVNEYTTNLIRLRHNVMTRIKIDVKDEKISLDKIGVGNKEYFKVEIRDNDIFITPIAKFNFTNIHIVGEKYSYHFLLKEIPYTEIVDSYLIIRQQGQKYGIETIIGALKYGHVYDGIKNYQFKNRAYKSAIRIMNKDDIRQCYYFFDDMWHSYTSGIEFYIIDLKNTVIGAECDRKIQIIRGRDGKSVNVEPLFSS